MSRRVLLVPLLSSSLATFATLATLATLATVASGATIHVPSDHKKIQAAVNAANDGDVIVVAKGTYAESVSIQSKTNLTVKGSGKVFIDAGGGDVALAITDCTGLTLSNLRVRNAIVAGVSIDTAEDLVMKKCKVAAGAPIGIQGVGVVGSRFDRCRVDGATTAFDVDGRACRFTGLKLFTTTGTALELRGPNHLVENCHVEGATTGIEVVDGVAPAAGAVIEGNTVLDCAVNGIRAVCVRSVIRNNAITNPGATGINVTSSAAEIVILGNTVTGSGGRGITVSGGRTTVRGNQVTGSVSDAIGLLGPEAVENFVVVNTCTGNTGLGYFVQGTGNTLIANTSSSNGGDFQNFGGEPTNSFMDNSFDTAAAVGTVIHVPVDQPTIAAAIQAAQLDDVIELAPGTYAEAVDLTGVGSLTLRGAATGGDAVIDSTAGITLFGSPQVRLENLVVRNATSTAVSVGSSNTVTLDNVRVESGATKSFTCAASKRIRLVNCLFPDGATLDSSVIHVDGCTIDGAVDGLKITSHHVLVEHCTVNNTTGEGIHIGQSSPVTFGIVVDQNDLTALFGDAIHVASASTMIDVTANNIDGSAANGVEIDATVAGTTVLDNVFLHCQLNGVLSSSVENVLLGNTAKQCGNGFSLFAATTVRNAVFGNIVRKSVTDGIRIDSGAANAVIGNDVKKSTNEPFEDLNPAGDNIVFDNIFKS